MKLIIIRHGETIQNAKGIIQGHTQGMLSKKGIAQAKELALLLKSQKIDAIFSSDLRRAVQTTKYVAKYHKAPIFYTKEIRERNIGIYQGHRREKMDTAIKLSNVSKVNFKPKYGENYIQLTNRVKKFISKISNKYKNKTVLISTHAGTSRALISILLKIPIEKAVKLKTRNAGILIIEIKKPKNKKIKDTLFISPENLASDY